MLLESLSRTGAVSLDNVPPAASQTTVSANSPSNYQRGLFSVRQSAIGDLIVHRCSRQSQVTETRMHR